MKKIQAIAFLACAASLFAQETAAPAQEPAAPAQQDLISCEAAFNEVKNTYPRDAATNSIYATVNARIFFLNKVKKEDRNNQNYKAGLKSCDLVVELLKTQLANVALRKSIDSLTKNKIEVQRQISAIKDSLINIWSSDAQGAKSLNAALSAERSRLEALNKEKERALAVKDSLLAVQKAEAEKKLTALQSKTISVYKDARGTILSMSDILFETGKADLKQELKENLAAIGAILSSLLTESKITVEGHTDNVGGEAFNQKLSEQRALAVMQYLIERGIDKNRLESVGYGFSKPVADNATDEGKAKNRRVELIIKD